MKAVLSSVILSFFICAFSLFQLNSYVFPDLKYFPTMPQAKNNVVTDEGVALGRYLFYDPILSRDSSLSCASCHKQENAFSDISAFSEGFNNVKTKRNTPPLFNLAWYPGFFWDGRAASLEEQVFEPVRNHDELNLNWSEAELRIKRSDFYKDKFQDVFGTSTPDSVLISMAIAQFERVLISNNSKYDRVLYGKEYFSSDEYQGFLLVNNMEEAGCIHCHTTDANALGTSLEFSNNGLDGDSLSDLGRAEISGDEKDKGAFKVPSIRNLVFTSPYMHDGRFKTIDEVIEFYSNGVKNGTHVDAKMEKAHIGGVRLNDLEKKYLKKFLLTLSDSDFVTNPAFSNPF